MKVKWTKRTRTTRNLKQLILRTATKEEKHLHLLIHQEQHNSENLVEAVIDEERNTSILPPALLNKYIQDVEATKQLNKATASDEPIEAAKKHPLSTSNFNNNKKSNLNKKLSKLNEDELEELRKNNFDADGKFVCCFL